MCFLCEITAGEELTYDYNLQCLYLQAQQPCYFESSKYRDTIGTKQQTTTATTNIDNNNNHFIIVQNYFNMKNE